jgi:NADH-quinone oxidoreductase subunit F
VIDRFGQGMRSGSRFKMALTGGAAGTIIPEELLDVTLDFDAHKKGVALGSGAVMVFDTSVSAAELLVWLLRFFAAESCGKCTPCRQGTHVARQIVERIVRGEGNPEDRAELRRLAEMLHATSLCGLGQSVAWPILSALANFPQDFEPCLA